MRRREQISPAAVAAGAWIPLDNNLTRWDVSVAVLMNGSVLTYSIEVTYDDLLTNGAPTPVAFPAPAGLTAQSANAAAQLPGPVTGVRINVTAFTSGPGAKMEIIQQGLQ